LVRALADFDAVILAGGGGALVAGADKPSLPDAMAPAAAGHIG
jgi:hypothetical protein